MFDPPSDLFLFFWGGPSLWNHPTLTGCDSGNPSDTEATEGFGPFLCSRFKPGLWDQGV